MTDHAQERLMVRAPLDRIYDIVVDFEHYAQWAADIKAVTVHERDAEGRGTVVTFRAAAFGRSTSYTLVYDYAAAPTSLSWVQRDGDLTSRIDGAYIFEALGEWTDVTYDLSVDLKVPVPGFIKRRAEGRIIHTALRDLKARAEDG